MAKRFPGKTLLCVLSLFWFSMQATAGIVIGGTRFVFGETQKGLTISVRNNSDISYLIETRSLPGGDWAGSVMPAIKTSAFIATPPLFLLRAGKENTLRLIQIGAGLPENKESLFTLDISAIPSGKGGANTVQVAVRSQLKLFYRPKGLKGNPQQAYTQLRWHREGGNVIVENPSPYYVTLFQVTANGRAVGNAGMVPPFGKRNTDWCGESASCLLSWQTIDDYGRVMPAVSLTVKGSTPVSVVSSERKK